jgi:hypothetical protein
MRIDGTGFGYIIVDGVRYDYDVVITDRVMKRKKELSAVGSGHTPLTGEEVLHYFSERPPEVLVVGTGQSGLMPLSGVKEACEKLNIELIVERTPDAVRTFNKLRESGRNVNAIFHVTC